jgi:8-oxo-dGTP pyrophosphatase MutT (NUDIX family)
MWSRIGKDGGRYWGGKGAGVFFTNGKKVLLLKRSGKGDNGGTWGLPGGKLEEGESSIDGAIREAKEECGRIKGQRFDDLKETDGLHDWTTFFFKVEKPFKCKLSDEHTDYKWVELENIKKYNLHPKLRENLDRHLTVVKKSFKKGIIKLKFKEWIDLKKKH